MDREETRREIQRLWINWPERKRFKDSVGLAALSFYGSIQNANESVLQDGDFGSGEQYLKILDWVSEWRRTWGRKQHCAGALHLNTYEPPVSQ
jgi:hypothetical protein